MKGLHEELIISGNNKDLVSYLTKLALAILEQSIDVKNIKIDTVKDADFNIRATYWRHPVGGWLDESKKPSKG